MFAALLLLGCAPEREAVPPKPQPIDDFRLVDQHGVSHGLGYYAADGQVTLVGWSPECELAWPAEGIVFGLDPTGTPREDIDEVSPVLQDDTGTIATSLTIERAGDVVVFDMDEWTWLRVARGPEECAYDLDAAPVTLSQAAEVIDDHCMDCHHGEARIPLFATYQAFYGWSAMIRSTIRTHRMPPGGHDAYYSQVEGGASAEDLALLVRYIDARLPRANEEPDPFPELSAAAATPRVWPEADHVFSMTEVHELPAKGPDEYRYAQISEPLAEDLWVESIRLTLNKDVTHHVNLVAIDRPLEQEVFLKKGTTDMLRLRKGKRRDDHGIHPDAEDPDLHWIEHMLEERIVMTYGRSKRTLEFEDGRAMKIPAGSMLALEIHYGLTGKPETNHVEVFITEAEPGAVEVKRANLYRDEFEIPAHAEDHVIRTGLNVPEEITLLEFVPHMHRRGKSARYSAIYPDGTEEVLLSVPFFQYKFQPHWRLETPKTIPAGTRLMTEMTYDNSERNPINPDPEVAVYNGSKRIEEMHLPRFYYVEGRP